MMQHPDMPMINMSDNTDMSTMIGMTTLSSHTNKKKTNHLTHGIFVCPLCNGTAFSNPLLIGTPLIPPINFTVFSYKYTPYQAQAPPIHSVKTTYPRAPPTF